MADNGKAGKKQLQDPSPPYSANKSVGVSLNVHLAVPPTTVASGDGSHTPNTPEILNSIVNMQAAREAREAGGPFAAEFANQCAIQSNPQQTSSVASGMHQMVDAPTTLSLMTPVLPHLCSGVIRS